MARDLAQIQNDTQAMIRDDAERDRMFYFYDLMDRNAWELPKEIRVMEWVMKVISSDPHDAISTASRILSTLPHTITYLPLGPGEFDKERANQIERILNWEMRSLNRRRTATVASDLSRSAIKYSALAAQVIDLDYQIEQKRMIRANTRREEFIRRISRFVVKTHNPRKIHVRISDYAPEEVVLADVRDAKNVIDEWGDRAKNLLPLIEAAKNERDRRVLYYDYTAYDWRAVWCARYAPHAGIHAIDTSMVIMDEENPLPFMNWVALMGGTTLEDLPEHKYQGLLYAVYTSGAWEVQNVIESLMASEGIAHTGSPRFKEEGPNIRESEVNWMSPDRIAKVPPQNVLTPLQSQELDQALSDLYAIFSAKVDKSTVSRILQGGEIPAGVAFATLNLATQTAVGVLKPAKDLTEKGLAEVYTLILEWINHSNKPLVAYGTDKKKDLGVQYSIDPQEIDPGAIYMECELHPDVPSDRQQRINASSMAVESLEMSLETALDDIGIADPRGEIKKRMKERLVRHMIELKMEEDRARLQMDLEIEAMQRMAPMQQQPPLDMNQAQAMGEEEGALPLPTMAGAFPGGQGFNPANSGEPPSLANPAGTREMIRGQDFLGNEMGNLI